MKRICRLLAVLSLAVLLPWALCACRKNAEPAPAAPEEAAPDLPGGETAVVPETPAAPAAPETAPDAVRNPLTGLADGITAEMTQRRPVAIMVSNIVSSLPQWGVGDADILIEMLAEGRISRLMAIFQDPGKIDRIASIRSARPYFIDMAQSYGAVYIHFGGSVPAYEAIAARSELLEIDGIGGGWKGALFDRDPGRKAQLGSEHSVYTTGARLLEGLPKLGRELTQTGNPSAFTFADTSSAVSGESGVRVQFSYSENHRPWFAYDAASGEYLRFEYGKPQIDGLTGDQIAVKNVLLLRMDTTDVKGSKLGLVEIQTTGSGEGYYFCGGRYIPVTGQKERYDSPLRILCADGSETVFAPGKTFLSCILRTAKVSIE